MTFREALVEMGTFWKGPLPFGPGTPEALARLEHGLGRALPEALRAYVAEVLPAERVRLTGIGTAVELFGAGELLPAAAQPITKWSAGWLHVGDIHGNPLVLDLDDPSASDPERWPVLDAHYGQGGWSTGPIAESLPVFLLVAAAMHHALTGIVEQPIEDDARGFILAEPAARWLFPRVKRWTPAHAMRWLGLFDNNQI